MITADRWQLAVSLLRDDAAELVALRQRVRLWLAQHTPQEWRNRIDRISKPELRRWHRMVAEAGFAAPHWPKSVGGMGASLREQLVIADEWAAVGAPHLMNMPLRFLAPGLMKFGTDAQKKFFLPRILFGEMFFCQLYSESEAGSDLGNVRTTARIEGDRFIVSGTKLWSTAADYADWGFALVRTGGHDLPGPRGLSMLLIDLASSGVTVRPIPTIYGEDEFCEVILDDVSVPIENLLGGLHQGWNVSNEILAAERLSSSHPVPCLTLLRKIVDIVSESSLATDLVFQDRLAQIEIDILAASALYLSACESSNEGAAIGTLSSVLKARIPDLLQALGAMLLEVTSRVGGRFAAEVEASRLYLQSRRSTIYGGTAEIQRNIIAHRILGLPRG